jgi:hypothetical protein
LDTEIEGFRGEICQRYLKVKFDIRKVEPFVYSNEKYWEALYQSYNKGGYDYDSLKKVFDICSRPTQDQIIAYKQNPKNKVNDIEYSHFDDKTFGLADIYPLKIENYVRLLNLIFKYEDKEKKHVHKGTIFYFLLKEFFEQKRINDGLLFVNKAFIEDDLKHVDTKTVFPNSPAYKFIILDRDNPEHALLRIVEEISYFTEEIFLNDFGHSYKDFWNKFLNEASKKATMEDAHKWFDHVNFFNSFIIRLKRTYDLSDISWDIYDSFFGELVLSNFIGELCLFIESFCKIKLNCPGLTIGGVYYQELKSIYGWHTDYYRGNDFKGENLENTLVNIISDEYHGCRNSILNSFYLTWGLRNNFHHNVESLSIIKKHFKPIIKKQLKFFFDFAITK